MKKIFAFFLIGIFMISLSSAVWWNPFSWFDDDNPEITKGERWIQTFNDNPDLYTVIPDNSKHDADIYLCSKTAKKKSDLKDLDFATSDKNKEKELKTKDKIEAIEYEDKICYYYKPTNNEKFLKFDKHSTHFVYTNESITANMDGNEIGSLSLITEDFEYKNGKPNINVGLGKNQLTHTFFVKNWSNNSITNIRTINLRTDEEVDRNVTLKFLTHENETIPTYNCINTTLVNGTIESSCSENGTEIVSIDVWVLKDKVVEGKDYIVGVFANIEKEDYVDIDFDYYGTSVMDSPINWATWEEILLTDIVSYYKFDSNADDSTESNDGVVNGATLTTGKINNAYLFDGSDDNISYSSIVTPIGEKTVSLWFKGTSDGLLYGNTLSSSQNGLFIRISGGSINSRIHYSSAGNQLFNFVSSAATYNDNNWHYLVFSWDGTTNADAVKFYIDGNSAETDTSTGTETNTPTNNLVIGESVFGGSVYGGIIDEVGIWERSLNSTEVDYLYNGGDGISYPFASGVAPSVTLTSPADGANLTSSSVDMIATVTDDEYVQNVTLYLDGIANETDTTHTNGTYTFTKIVSEGVHTWSILAYDNSSLSNQSVNRTFNYTQPPIYIDLNNPSDSYVSQVPLVNMNCNASEASGITQINLTINGIVNETVVNSTVGQNLSISKDINFSEGDYIWGCQAENDMTSASSSNRTLNVTYSNPIITLDTPANDSLFTISNITFTFNATDLNGVSNVTLYINGTVSEVNSSGVNGSYIFEKTLADGEYNWKIGSVSILGKESNSTTRVFSIDSLSPNNNITSPTGVYDYLYSGFELDLNWTIEDPNLDSCWYRYPSLTDDVSYSENNVWNDGNFSTSSSSGTYYMNYTGTGNFSYSFGFTNYSRNPQLTCNSSTLNQIRLQRSGGLFMLIQCYDGAWNTIITQGGGPFSVYEVWHGELTTFEYLNCSANHTTFPYITSKNNLTVYANDTVGNSGSGQTVWYSLATEINKTNNDTRYITELNPFEIYLESTATSITNPLLIYEGKQVSASATSSNGGFYLRSTLITNETFIGNNSFYWNVTLDGSTISTREFNQNVTDINFEICNSNNTVEFLKLNFTDELNFTALDATIRTSSFEYYLEDPLAKKTYIYSNVTENPEYSFCFDPSIRNITATSSVSYSSEGYPERTFGATTVLSNQTINQTLRLLAEDSGLYATFEFLDSTTKTSLSDVSVQIYDGSTLVIAKTTDDSGIVSEWLNPNVLYEIISTKTGYSGDSRGIRPITTDPYVIELISDEAAADPTIVNGLVTLFYPTQLSLEENTSYDFGFYAKEGEEEIDKMRITLYDQDNSIIYTTEKSGDGNITQETINTYQNQSFVVFYEIEGVDGGYWSYYRTYYISLISSEDYSIDSWGRSFNTHFPAEERTTLTKLTWYIIWFVCMMGGFSFGYNGSYKKKEDYANNISIDSRSDLPTGLFFAFLITWVFCLYNFIPFNLINYPSSYWGAEGVEWIQQYFFAVIMLLPLIPSIKTAIGIWSKRGN